MATANELRQMNSEELGRMAGETRQNLFNMQLKHRTGHLENTAELGKARRELARLQTLIRETQLGIQRAIKAEPAKAQAKGRPGTEGAAVEAKKKAKAPAEKAAKPKKAAK